MFARRRLPRSGSVDEEVRNEILRSGRHRVTIEIRYAVFTQQRIINEEISARRARGTGENQPGGVGENLGLATFVRIDARYQLQRGGRDRSTRPKTVDADSELFELG